MGHERQRLPHIGAVFSAVRNLFVRPVQSDHANGYHEIEISEPLPDVITLELLPIEPLPPRRTKPATPPPEIPVAWPIQSDEELLPLRGHDEIVHIAQRIRERFWTQVVRSLAEESAYGISKSEIQFNLNPG